MSRRRWFLGGFGAVAAAIGVTSFDRPAPPPPGSGVLYSEARHLLEDAYDVTKWSVRLPAEWAGPRLVRTGLSAWVATLPLAPDVRARVDARLSADGFVDELVPFAAFVKEMYDRPDVDDFATWARANVRRDSGIPGLQHSLFSFAPPADAGSSLPGIPKEQAARFLALYDAVYLQDAAPDGAVTDHLACDADDARLEARAARAAPIVKDLVHGVADGMEEGEIKDGVEHVLRDDDTLQAVTLTLVEFIDGEVCKHYRIFAARTVREHQLEAFLETSLLDPENPDGWVWLRWHASRHLAVHVVVDGLQGHLAQALAEGKPGDPFLSRVLAEEAIEGSAKPRAASAKPGPAMSTGYLKWAAEHGSHELPYFTKIYAGSGVAEQGISTTPTISVRNLPIAKTGAPVGGKGGTGIPNFHFVDRTFVLDGVQQGRPWYFYGNDALQLTRLTHEAGMRTLFERFDRLATMSCGGQYDEAARYSFDSFLALAVGEKSRDFGELRCVGELRRRAANERRIAEIRAQILAREPILRAEHYPWEWYDRWAQEEAREDVTSLVAELASLEPVGMPDYLLWYDPWPDHFAHAKGPFSDEIIGPTGELVRLDHWLGQVAATYHDAGVEDRTLFGMAGDHGLTPVRWIVSPEAEVVGGLEKAGVTLVVKKISSDEGEGPKLTHRLHPPSMRGIDLVVASTAGGNYMMDLFVDQGENWARQPILSELRHQRTLGGKTIDFVEEVVTRLGDSLDYLAVRESACDVQRCATAMIGPRAGKRAIGHLDRRGNRVWYGWEGADPLDLAVRTPYEPVDPGVEAEVSALLARCSAASHDDPSTWCTEDEWRSATRVNARPDAVSQLARLYDTDRAGTINLFPRAGVGYNTKVPGRHAGESFHEKDAFVGLWGAPVQGPRPAVAVNGSVPMAMYTWVTGEPAVEGEDGWGYPSIFDIK